MNKNCFYLFCIYYIKLEIMAMWNLKRWKIIPPKSSVDYDRLFCKILVNKKHRGLNVAIFQTIFDNKNINFSREKMSEDMFYHLNDDTIINVLFRSLGKVGHHSIPDWARYARHFSMYSILHFIGIPWLVN